MTHKYERQCWYCGSKNMERLTNHVKCLDCGATWNYTPQLGPEVMERGLGSMDYSSYQKGGKKGRPSAAVVRQAAKARSHQA